MPSLPDREELSELVFKIFRNLLVVYFVLLLFDYVSSGNVGFYFNLDNLLYLLIGSGAASLIFYAEKLEKFDKNEFDRVKKFIFYAFLGLLLMMTVQSLAQKPVMKGGGMLLMIDAIVFGALTFYLNRDKLDNIDEEAREEENEEKKREIEFAGKFPGVNKILGVRRVARWMYKDGYWYSVGLIVIILVGAILRLWDVYQLSFWHDEAISMLISKRIFEGNLNTFISGEFYWRALPYHFFLSLAFFFKNIYFGSRFLNLFFYIPLCFLIYLFSKKINKSFALLSVYFFVFSAFNIAMFREARFYELFVLLFTLNLYLFIMVLDKIDLKNKIPNIIKYFSIYKKSLFFIVLVFILGFYTSYQMFYLIYPILLYTLVSTFNFKNRNYFFLFLGGVITLVIALLYRFGSNFSLLWLIKQPALEWKPLNPEHPFSAFIDYLSVNNYPLIYVLFAFFFISFFIFKKKYTNFIFCSLFSLITITSLQGYGMMAPRYYYFIMPVFSIGISYFFYCIFKITKTKNERRLFITLFILTLSLIFIATLKESNSISTNSSSIPIKNNNFISMFKIIDENYKDHVIIADAHSSIPFFIYFNRTPDYMLFEDPRNVVYMNKDLYLNVSFISYKNISEINEDVVIILWYSPINTPKELMSYLSQNSDLVYRDGAKRIYLMKKNSKYFNRPSRTDS